MSCGTLSDVKRLHYVPAKHRPSLVKREWRWEDFRVPYPTMPKRKRYCCDICKRARLEDRLWRCVYCGSEACEHMFRTREHVDTRRVDGTGICHVCRRARNRAWAKHYGLDEPLDDSTPLPEGD
jgi:hypothetical protein